ncbi:MAG: YsnF/AvaK domain-containing protein [Ktedonobacteraceae bacterium]|nr:YsnF/AvaK domain-containing protein [Ktedonobacteraceae bacterium]
MAVEERTTVLGIFRDRTLADQAIAELRQAGWGLDEVKVIGRNTGGGVLASLKSALTQQEATTPGAVDDLAGLDLPQDQRQLYQHALESGDYIVLARTHGHQLEVRDILHRHGALNVFTPFEMGGERTVQLRQEVPQIQKYVVDTGEIRIHKRVITEQKTFTVPVTREEVTIERLPRTPAAQVPAAHPGSAQFQAPGQVQNMPIERSPVIDQQSAVQEDEVLREGGTLRILVREEQVFINKTPVVVEEITVRKQALQETRTLVEPIRHEEARIEQAGNVAVRETRTEPGSAPAPVADRQNL